MKKVVLIKDLASESFLCIKQDELYGETNYSWQRVSLAKRFRSKNDAESFIFDLFEDEVRSIFSNRIVELIEVYEI